MARLWQRIFPWRLVRREDWDELVAAVEDLRQQNWDLAARGE